MCCFRYVLEAQLISWWLLPIGLYLIASVVAFLSFAEINTAKKQISDVEQSMRDLINSNRCYERLGVDLFSLSVGADLMLF